MEPTNGREQAEAADRLRIPPPPPRTPPGRALHLVPVPGPELPEAQASAPIRPLSDGPSRATATPERPTGPTEESTVGRVHPANLRRLERELAEVQDEVGALQEMLEELPAILERKFRGRLDKMLEQQRLLEADNRGLRRRLLALCPGVDLETQALQPRALLPPSSRTALKLRNERGGDQDNPDLADRTTDSRLQG